MNNAYIRAQQCKVREAKFPFVKIGSQYWTTKNLSLSVTPQGTLIPEVQANGNVEKIVNGGFDTASNWTKSANVTILSGMLVFNSPGSSFYYASQSINMTAGRRYKISITAVDYISGQYQLTFNNNIPATVSTPINSYGNGTQSVFYTAIGNEIELRIARVAGTTLKCSFDNVSIQEIGWSGSQELYDGIYAQTSGTVEQKTYAAVKAAAMWSNYNNDAPTGVIYGKLYNWFAVKLLQMDIDYYNAANPTKPYIWRVPTVANGNTLNTYLGGDTIAGGKIKIMGNVYYTDNIGATNETGLTILGAGSRDEGGGFASINARGISWSQTEVNPTVASYCIYTKNTDATNQLSASNKMRGYSIRLIKA